MSQGRLPYSSASGGVYHPAAVVVTAPGPAPSHHDVRWQQAVAAAAAAAAVPSPYSVRSAPVSSERARVGRYVTGRVLSGLC